jgi:hypothetical protein
MTKEEILAAAGFPNTPEGIAAFYNTYGSREEWDQAQQQMAYGGMPDIMGVPFGAGITMRDGGLTKYQGDVTGSQVPYINKFGKITEATNTLNFEDKGQKEIRIPFKRDVDLEHRNIAMKLNQLYSGSVGRGGDYNPEATTGTYTVAKEMYNDMNNNPQFDYKKYQNKVDSLYKVYPPMGYRDGGTPYYGGPIRPYAYGGIPKAVYGKTIPPTGVPELGSNIKGATSNVDLTAPVKWNQDPTQISKDANTGGYNAFQSWLQKQQYEGQPFINNPSLNTPEGKKKMTEWALNEFNTKSDYVQKFPQNKITPESVKAIQEYHKKSDPSVQVDSWVGSQTSRMRYPTPTAMYEEAADKTPLSTEGYVPVTYGNKQYVVDASKYAGGKQPRYSDFVPYDPAQHHEKLQKPKSSSQYEKYYKTFKSSKYGGAPCYNCGGSPMEYGGAMTQDLQGQYPIFGQGGYDYGGPSPFNYGAFPAMSHGGDLTSQGGNQALLKDRKDSYMSFIQNNVMKDLHQKTSKEVGDAFMEMEQGQYQMPDSSMMDNSMMAQYGTQIDPQNAALQNMYRQGMDQYNTQKRQDYSNFGAMTEDFLGQISNQYAKGGQEGKIHTPNWEYSNYVPTNDIRTGYALGKKDFAKLAKLQGEGKVTGAKLNYNALGRLAPKWFGPKSIELGITGPAFGRFEDQMRVKPSFSIPGQEKNKKSQGPYPETQNAPEVDDRLSDMQHGKLVPLIYPWERDPRQMMSSNFSKQPSPNKTMGPVNNTFNPFPMEEMLNSKNNAMVPYSEQFNKAYGGLIHAQIGKQTPIDMQPDYLEQKNSLDLFSKYVDDDSKNRMQATEDAGLKDPETNSLYGSDSITLKKKTTGIGRFFGKNSALIADTASSVLKNKDNLNSQKELGYSMLGDNRIITTPLDAKNKGGYDPNSGVYQPDQYVTRYGGVNWGTPNVFQTGGDFEEGEEADLTEEEIQYYRDNGYNIEYLD